MAEPSEELKRALGRPFTFDLLRDAAWQPSREDYRALRNEYWYWKAKAERQEAILYPPRNPEGGGQ